MAMTEERNDCTMEQSKFERLKEFIKGKIIHMDEAETKGLLAEIFNMWNVYCISGEQEEELYNLVDPGEKYNSPADYWFEGNYSDVTVWQFIENELLSEA